MVSSLLEEGDNGPGRIVPFGTTLPNNKPKRGTK